MDKTKAEQAIHDLLEALDQDVSREGLKDTPKRVAKMLMEQCTDSEAELDKVFSEVKLNDLTMVRDIPVYSFCEHHLVPWYGRAHIAYIPQKRVIGISKLARLAYKCCKGFTIQETVTKNIADSLHESLEPKGVMVVIEAVHMCMCMRGARAVGASTTTSAVRGVFRDVVAARHEFLSLVTKGGPR